MSIALFLLTLFFAPSPAAYNTLALPSTVAHLTPRPVALQLPQRLVAAQIPRRLPAYRVTATVYSAQAQQTDAEPFVTADNSRITPQHSSRHRWMALSRDMLQRWGGQFAYGDSVLVRGISPELDGVYVIHDTMNRRLHHTMDILVGQHEHIYGRWTDVTIRKVTAQGEPVS